MNKIKKLITGLILGLLFIFMLNLSPKAFSSLWTVADFTPGNTLSSNLDNIYDYQINRDFEIWFNNLSNTEKDLYFPQGQDANDYYGISFGFGTNKLPNEFENVNFIEAMGISVDIKFPDAPILNQTKRAIGFTETILESENGVVVKTSIDYQMVNSDLTVDSNPLFIYDFKTRTLEDVMDDYSLYGVAVYHLTEDTNIYNILYMIMGFNIGFDNELVNQINAFNNSSFINNFFVEYVEPELEPEYSINLNMNFIEEEETIIFYNNAIELLNNNMLGEFRFGGSSPDGSPLMIMIGETSSALPGLSGNILNYYEFDRTNFITRIYTNYIGQNLEYVEVLINNELVYSTENGVTGTGSPDSFVYVNTELTTDSNVVINFHVRNILSPEYNNFLQFITGVVDLANPILDINIGFITIGQFIFLILAIFVLIFVVMMVRGGKRG